MSDSGEVEGDIARSVLPGLKDEYALTAVD